MADDEELASLKAELETKDAAIEEAEARSLKEAKEYEKQLQAKDAKLQKKDAAAKDAAERVKQAEEKIKELLTKLQDAQKEKVEAEHIADKKVNSLRQELKKYDSKVEALEEDNREKDRKKQQMVRKINEERKMKTEEEEAQRDLAVRNVIFGLVVIFLFAVLVLAMIFDTLWASYDFFFYAALTVFVCFCVLSVLFCGALVCGKDDSKDDWEMAADYNFEEDKIEYRWYNHVTDEYVDKKPEHVFVQGWICALLFVSAVALIQFQFYLGLVAWAYPYLLTPKALMNVENAYNASVRELDLSAIAGDMDWTYDRMPVPESWTTAVTQLGKIDHILPTAEHIGLVAHCVPIMAALIYQFGVGALGYAGLAGIVIDYVDVQDFYLLLLENDIVVSYWSRPLAFDETYGGGDVSRFGQVNVTLKDGSTQTFRSNQKEFEDWQKQGVILPIQGLFLDFDLEGSYYNYWMWRHIFIVYIIASIYVAFWPWFSEFLKAVVFKCCCAEDLDLPDEEYQRVESRFFDESDEEFADQREKIKQAKADKGKRDAALLGFQSLFSLFCVELPFLFYRLACSQYYGIVISSLFIKNVVSIFMDIMKLCSCFFGLDLSAAAMQTLRRIKISDEVKVMKNMDALNASFRSVKEINQYEGCVDFFGDPEEDWGNAMERIAGTKQRVLAMHKDNSDIIGIKIPGRYPPRILLPTTVVTKSYSCWAILKTFLRGLVEVGKFIGEDIDEDTKDIVPICSCFGASEEHEVLESEAGIKYDPSFIPDDEEGENDSDEELLD